MTIDFLTTGIGRGHRFYLEGLLAEVMRLKPGLGSEISVSSDLSHGAARLAWSGAEALYRLGSRSGPIGG
ncbi:MAG: hypothetical protein ACE5GA_07630, partial [Candidatus Zixiibacteriota bacterium]